ncbi:MAG: aromatic ring-hydroxylating dioxygenase subunit alpha [Pseudomonadota bacterium]
MGKSESTRQRNSRQKHYENLRAVMKHDKLAPPPGVLDESFDEIEGTAVATARYTSEAFYRREVETLWPKVWQVAGWAQDIPNPGDVLTYDVANLAALIVRQRDGSLKAFHNSCLHRGMRICDDSSKTEGLASLRCPFHGFTWKLDGSCKIITEKWDFSNLAEENLNLPEFQVAEWQGYVFVNADLSAPPLEAYLGDLPRQWETAGWDLTGRHKAVHVRKHIRANWKVAQEAFLEFLHGNYVHNKSITPAAPAEAMRQDVFPGEPNFARGIGVVGVLDDADVAVQSREQRAMDHFINYYAPEFQDWEELKVKPGGTARENVVKLLVEKFKQDTGADLSGMNPFDVTDYVWYNVFPNFMPWPTLGYPLGYWFLPDGGPSQCTMDIILLLPFSGERPPSAKRIDIMADEPTGPVLGPVGDILDEDMANMERVQRGLESSATGVVNFSDYNEVRIRHFHQTLGKYTD